MQYRRLGNTGLEVSNLCLGTMAFGRWSDEKTSLDIISQSIDLGINFVDTADFYGKGQDWEVKVGTGESETILGKGLKGRRDKMVICTKFGFPMSTDQNHSGYSKAHILREVDEQLKRLDTDYIDLYMIHRFNPSYPAEETLRALEDLVRMGKVRYTGSANISAWQMAKLNGICDRLHFEKLCAVQVQYNLLSREIEQEMLPYCISEGVGVMVYSPLARGVLSGRYNSIDDIQPDSRAGRGEALIRKYFTPQYFAMLNQYKELAQKYGITMAQLATSWVFNQKGVTSALVGASKPYHIEDAAKVADLVWTQEMLDEVAAVK